MKVLRTSLLAIMVFCLMSGVCYGQTAADCRRRGLDYVVIRDFERARHEFRKALEIDPSDEATKNCLQLVEDALVRGVEIESVVYLFLGDAYLEQEMLDKAIVAYEKAVEGNPNYARARDYLGVAYGEKGMYDKAVAQFEQAIEIDSRYAAAYYNLGVAYTELRMYDEAIAAYKKAVEINPEHTEAHNGLGLAYYFEKMYDEAIATYERAIGINPNFADAYNNLAVACYDNGEYSLAVKYCDRAIELGYQVHPELLKALEPYREK